MEDIPNICDVMYIGGTKCGALFGEAVVIMNEKIKKDFRYRIKQRGAMMAKGRLLGIQFYELFKDNLYLEIGKKTVNSALYLKEELKKQGVKLFIDSYTNQQFVMLSKETYEEISKKFLLSFWAENKDGIVCRLCKIHK
jgi:threonine aldolase